MADDKTSNPPVNFNGDLDDLKVHFTGVLAVDGDSRVGILTVATQIGHYDFLINQELANEMVQQLREFISGDCEQIAGDK
jgi:hypothetical protein